MSRTADESTTPGRAQRHAPGSVLLRLTAALALMLALACAFASVAAAEAPTLIKPEDQKSVVGKAIAPLTINGSNIEEITQEGLPAGLKLALIDPSHAEITGTPETAGIATVTLHAKNGAETTETSFKWTVTEPPPTVNKPEDQKTVAGKPVELTITGTNMTHVTAGSTLPKGLTINRINDTEARITGTPTKAETREVTVTAENEEKVTASTKFNWAVEPETAPSLEAPPHQVSTVGKVITPLVIKGTHMAQLAAAPLPAGLTFERISETEGAIKGTPTQAESVVITLTATNEEGAEVSVTFEWTVLPLPPPPPPSQGPTSSGALAVSPGVVFSAARASCGGLSWSTSAVVTQWLLDGAPIAGATAATYTPPRAYDGRRLSCRQTATGGGGSSSASSPGRVVHEQPAQPSWPIGPASTHCSAPVCMQEGARPGATGQAYPQGGSWWGSQQVRCVSAPWTSAVGDSAQPAVKAFAQASTVRLTLQRITSAGPVTVASQELGNLGVARDLLDGASGSPFGGTIVSPFGGQPFQGNELWSTRFPGAAGKPNWFAPGAGLLAYGTSSPAGLARSFQLTYTLTSADLGARLRCLAGAEDGAPGAATVASFASPEYAVAPSGRCGPRRLAGVSGPQPAIVAAGDPRCLGAPSSMAAIGGGFQGVAVKNGEAAVSLVCGLSGGCRGSVSLLAARAHGAPVSVGGASVRVGRGGVRLLHLTLNRKGRQLLRGAGGAGLPASLRLSTRGRLRGLAAFTLQGAG